MQCVKVLLLLAISAAAATSGCATPLDYSGRAALGRDASATAFPTNGREVHCQVAEESPSYIQVAHPEACSFIATDRTYISLKVLGRTGSGQPAAYNLFIRAGDGPLPWGLSKNTIVTLRFLPDGTFFDVKEWSEGKGIFPPAFSLPGEQLRLQPLPDE